MYPATTSRRLFLKTAGALAAAAGANLPFSIAAESLSDASAAEKLGWRLGCNAYCFNRLTFYEAIDRVAALGLKQIVGFNWQKLDPKAPGAIFNEKMPAAARQETKKRLADAGVKLTSCYCTNLNDENICRQLFEFAAEMGMETLVGEPKPAAFDMLEKLCDEHKISLAVHNHAKPSPYWMPETLLKLFEGRSRRVGACCDTGHWARSGLDPTETLKKLQNRIITFDLKDVNERGGCVPFGTGKADIAGILKELRRQQFRGVLGIEYDSPAGDLEKDIARCVVFFNNTAKELSAT